MMVMPTAKYIYFFAASICMNINEVTGVYVCMYAVAGTRSSESGFGALIMRYGFTGCNIHKYFLMYELYGLSQREKVPSSPTPPLKVCSNIITFICTSIHRKDFILPIIQCCSHIISCIRAYIHIYMHDCRYSRYSIFFSTLRCCFFLCSRRRPLLLLPQRLLLFLSRWTPRSVVLCMYVCMYGELFIVTSSFIALS